MTNVIARASPVAFRVFGAIWGIPILIGAVASLRTAGALWPLGICVGLLAFTFLWLRTYSLVITDDEVLYRSLFQGNRRLRRRDIRRVSSRVGNASVRDAFKPLYRLEIESQTNGVTQVTVVNLKVFNPENRRAVLKVLGVGKDGAYPQTNALIK